MATDVATAVQPSAADGVVAMLSAIDFGMPIEIERSYAENDQDLKLEEPGPIRILVIAYPFVQTLAASRSTNSYLAPIDVVVVRKFPTGDQQEDTGRILPERIDELVALVQQIAEKLALIRLPGDSGAFSGMPQIMANPIPQHLREWRQFTGAVRVMCRADIDKPTS